MKRRVLVLGFVFLLGLAVLTVLPGCFEGEDIINCLGSSSRPGDWFGRPPLEVCMRAEVDAMGIVTWDFGDGTSGEGGSVTHTYTEVGAYEVVMDVVYPNSGKMATVTTIVRVVSEPVAAFTYEATEPPRPFFNWIFNLPSWFGGGETEEEEEEESEWLEIKFDARSSYPTDTSEMYRPAQVQWDFGDGTQETESVSRYSGWSFWGSTNDMIIRHTYPAAGVYTVTLTLTDNLGYSDTVTQTITVGTPGDDDEDEVEVDDFAVGTITWEPGDEEEDEGDCVFIDGTVQNNASVAAGVEVTATAYGVGGVPVGTFTYWPAGATNIGVGVNYTYGFFLCDLSIPGSQVVTVEVVVSDTAVY